MLAIATGSSEGSAPASPCFARSALARWRARRASRFSSARARRFCSFCLLKKEGRLLLGIRFSSQGSSSAVAVGYPHDGAGCLEPPIETDCSRAPVRNRWPPVTLGRRPLIRVAPNWGSNPGGRIPPPPEEGEPALRAGAHATRTVLRTAPEEPSPRAGVKDCARHDRSPTHPAAAWSSLLRQLEPSRLSALSPWNASAFSPPAECGFAGAAGARREGGSAPEVPLPFERDPRRCLSISTPGYVLFTSP